MNGSVFELVMLALAAQSGLGGDARAMGQVWPNERVFIANQWVRFTDAGTSGQTEAIAADPAAWLETLLADGTCSVMISSAQRSDVVNDRATSGFVGGGRIWTIQTSNGTQRYSWTPERTLDEAARDGGRPFWRLSVMRRPGDADSPAPPSLAAAGIELREALEDARDYAMDAGVSTWIESSFGPALTTLQEETRVDPNVIPLGIVDISLPDENARLLQAAMKAWVFGGMGSWNDGWYARVSQRFDYKTVSNRLFLAVDQAIVAAVNANDPGC